MMPKMQNKMESSDAKFPEEVCKLNESSQQLKSDLAITKNVNSQLNNRFVNWRGNARQVPNIVGENVWNLWVGYTHFSPG